MSTSQHAYYKSLDSAKEKVDRFLQAATPFDRKFVGLFQVLGFPMDFENEEACLYFALEDGLARMQRRTSHRVVIASHTQGYIRVLSTRWLSTSAAADRSRRKLAYGDQLARATYCSGYPFIRKFVDE